MKSIFPKFKLIINKGLLISSLLKNSLNQYKVPNRDKYWVNRVLKIKKHYNRFL